MQGFLTIREAARAGIAPETMIRRLVAQGRCPGVTSGKRFYVNISMLQEQLQQDSQPAKCSKNEKQ